MVPPIVPPAPEGPPPAPEHNLRAQSPDRDGNGAPPLPEDALSDALARIRARADALHGDRRVILLEGLQEFERNFGQMLQEVDAPPRPPPAVLGPRDINLPEGMPSTLHSPVLASALPILIHYGPCVALSHTHWPMLCPLPQLGLCLSLSWPMHCPHMILAIALPIPLPVPPMCSLSDCPAAAITPLGANVSHQITAGAAVAGFLMDPQAVIRILARGWHQYIPLNYLSDEACRSAMHAPPIDTETHTIVDGKLRSSSQGLDGSREHLMAKESWREAQSRFVRMIRVYCSLPNREALATAWATHFRLVEQHPRFSMEFSALLLYDIRCRQAHHLQAFDPSMWQDALWRDVLDERLLSHPVLRQAPTIPLRTTSDWSQRSYPAARARSRSASPRRAPLNPCVVCGREGHRIAICQPRKSFLVRQGRTWVLPDGKQVCYAWNSTKSGCPGCDRMHVCTLCGGRHSMLHCSRFAN